MVQRCEYTPYGEVASNTGTYNSPYKFTSKELDDFSGLYYYGARYYDAALCHFIQADTIVPEPLNPQSLNRYSYCDGNPINYTDPTGHSSWKKFWNKVGDFFEKNWEYVASAAIIVSTLFLATINPVAAAPFFYGEFFGAMAGGISAYQQGGDVGQGVLFGTFAGGITGGLSMGFKDYMLNTAFTNQIISPLQGGLITAGEFAIGGFGMGLIEGYAGGARSWSDAFRHAGISAAFGAGLGFAAGYSYTAGWQSFIHGADTRAHNKSIWQRMREALTVGGKTALDTASGSILPPIQTTETAGAIAEATPKIIEYNQAMYEECSEIYGPGSENPYYDVLGVRTKDGKPYSERIRIRRGR